MNILSQNYNNLKQKLDSLNSNNNVFNYINLLSNLDESLCLIACENLILLFETMDKEYSNSINRKRKYDYFDPYIKALDYSFLDNCLDYIYSTYDINKLEYIYVMRDCASWIKNLRYHLNFNSNIHVICGLDRFHFKQALHHICLDNDL